LKSVTFSKKNIIPQVKAKIQQLLPDGFISAFTFFFGKYNLPEVVAPGSKASGTGQQIIAPHAVKSFIINAF
jgi:hypothetical protein